MTAIAHALDRLDQAINNLEESVGHIEQRQAGQQHDMFSAPTRPSNGNGAAVAAKLDKAIERVETILREGGSRG